MIGKGLKWNLYLCFLIIEEKNKIGSRKNMVFKFLIYILIYYLG